MAKTTTTKKPRATKVKAVSITKTDNTVAVYSQEGKAVGQTSLPPELFALPWNADLVHQVVVSMRSNQRSNKAQVKDRGAVRGGGRKPWAQKGTGRARHGSNRSPIWRGGGVTHGPSNERNYFRKINAKMKTKALLTVLSQKQRDGEVIFLDKIEISAPKTSMAQKAVTKLSQVKGCERLGYKLGKRALFLVPQASEALVKSFRNLSGAVVSEVRNLNPVSALTYKYLILANPEASFPVLASRLK